MFHKSEKRDITGLEYYPYRALTRIVTGMYVCLELVAIYDFIIVPGLENKIFFAALLILNTVCACVLLKSAYPMMQVKVKMDKQGIALTYQKGRRSDFYADWTEFVAAYYVSRGSAIFLILTPQKIEPPTKKELLSIQMKKVGNKLGLV